MAVAPVTIAPWRLSLNPLGNGPYAVLVRLEDYLYEKFEGGLWVPRIEATALPLPHDIVVFNPLIYDALTGAFNPAGGNSTVDDRQRYGFYLSKPIYDGRAKPTKVLVPDGPYESIDPETGQAFRGYLVYEPAAALLPQESDYQNASFCFNAGGAEYNTGISVATEASGADSAFIVLGNNDPVLESSLAGTSFKAYTKLRFNTDITESSPAQQEIADIVQFFTGYGLDANGNPLAGHIVGGETPNHGYDELLNQGAGNEDANPALHSVYIWVRCSFFADYVQPGDFNQTLTATADVQHKNLIVGKGDYRRFSRNISGDLETVKPYIPVTQPRNDLLPTLVADQNAGSFLIPSRGTDYTGTSLSTRQTPLGWYDPDIDAAQLTDMIAIPKEGNSYTSGRIFSPTVDELWTYIKKLVDGRIDDDNSAYTPAAYGQKLEGPRASTSTKKVAASTRLPVEPALTLASSKLGDPLNADGTSYVNAPEGIQYALNANIKYIADKISGTDGSASRIDSTSYYPFGVHSSDTSASLASRAASRINHTAIQTTGEWAPRATPLSLRELEAKIMNCMYNMETAFNFMAANKVSTGNTDYTPEANPQGTLYQLHVGYTPDLDVAEGGTSSKWLAYGNTEVPVDTADTYGNELTSTPDTSAGVYDRVTHISQQDVYLSAEGKWRYLFDHVRIPVTNETY